MSRMIFDDRSLEKVGPKSVDFQISNHETRVFQKSTPFLLWQIITEHSTSRPHVIVVDRKFLELGAILRDDLRQSSHFLYLPVSVHIAVSNAQIAQARPSNRGCFQRLARVLAQMPRVWDNSQGFLTIKNNETLKQIEEHEMANDQVSCVSLFLPKQNEFSSGDRRFGIKNDLTKLVRDSSPQKASQYSSYPPSDTTNNKIRRNHAGKPNKNRRRHMFCSVRANQILFVKLTTTSGKVERDGC